MYKLILSYVYLTDDFEEIKQDILSFRFEVMNMWKMKEAVHEEMAANVKSLLKMMESGKCRVSETGSVIFEESDKDV